jgi:hypothetical protein
MTDQVPLYVHVIFNHMALHPVVELRPRLSLRNKPKPSCGSNEEEGLSRIWVMIGMPSMLPIDLTITFLPNRNSIPYIDCCHQYHNRHTSLQCENTLGHNSSKRSVSPLLNWISISDLAHTSSVVAKLITQRTCSCSWDSQSQTEAPPGAAKLGPTSPPES